MAFLYTGRFWALHGRTTWLTWRC